MEDLGEVLRLLGPQGVSPEVLVGLDEADDAAVIELSPTDALVWTLDFFTPVVDDAFDWGRIAAANATSDVYAMGGRPTFALNMVGWPRDTLPLELLADVLRGGLHIAQQAGMIVVGGHTVDDPEPKYGMCVLGRVDPTTVMRMDAARPGDVLVGTKALGTGIVTTGLKRDQATAEMTDAAVASMTHLNDVASRAFVKAGVGACTDVTGFGFLGHLHRMLRASGVAAEVDAGAVPILPGARELAEAGCLPGGTERNRSALEGHIRWPDVDEATRMLLADAQTSGGLLGACPPETAQALTAELATEPAPGIVGRVVDGEPGTIVVTA